MAKRFSRKQHTSPPSNANTRTSRTPLADLKEFLDKLASTMSPLAKVVASAASIVIACMTVMGYTPPH